jgi:TonB family protein
MKTKLTFLLALTFLFLFSGSVYGEEPEVKKEFYDSGKLKSETHYKDGKEEGLRTVWRKSGKRERETHYKNGEREGLDTYWYPSGRKKSERHYKNGKQDGLETEWLENGKKISDCKNDNRKSTGENQITHPKVNKHFNLIFAPDPKNNSHTNVFLESLSSNKKSLLANIKVLTPMELCGSLGCPAGLGENKAEFSNDDSIVAFSVEGTETIYVFETQSGEKIMSANYSTFALSPDGKRLVGGGYSWKTGWQLSMYRLDIKTKEALSGYDWDVRDEFGNENPDIKQIGDKEEWYDGTKFKKFNFTKNGENLILKNPARMSVNNVYNFKTKRFTRSCAGSDHEVNNQIEPEKISRPLALDSILGEDKPVPLNTKEVKYASYFARIKHKINGVWIFPHEAAQRGISGYVRLRFQVSKDGNLIGVILRDRSGYDILDVAALKAVKEAAPFDPFPSEIEKEKLSIEANFVYEPHPPK